MTTSMYCLYVGVDYTYIDVNALALNPFWPQKFGFKPLLGLERMYVCMYVFIYVCMYVCIH